jgi:hypothetical protein
MVCFFGFMDAIEHAERVGLVGALVHDLLEFVMFFVLIKCYINQWVSRSFSGCVLNYYLVSYLFRKPLNHLEQGQELKKTLILVQPIFNLVLDEN